MVADETSPIGKDDGALVTDEMVSTCTHLGGAVFSLLGGVLLVVQASVAGKPWHIAGFSLYGVSLVLMFLASALHHGVKTSGRRAHALRVFDYVAIFLLIAGTMTPICLVPLRGPTGWPLLGVAWAVTFAGALLKFLVPNLPKGITATLYVTVGWLVVTVASPIRMELGTGGLLVLVSAAALYTLGAVIYALERPNPFPGVLGFHEIWHLLVMAGAAGHYVFMLVYVLPLP